MIELVRDNIAVGVSGWTSVVSANIIGILGILNITKINPWLTAVLTLLSIGFVIIKSYAYILDIKAKVKKIEKTQQIVVEKGEEIIKDALQERSK